MSQLIYSPSFDYLLEQEHCPRAPYPKPLKTDSLFLMNAEENYCLPKLMGRNAQQVSQKKKKKKSIVKYLDEKIQSHFL